MTRTGDALVAPVSRAAMTTTMGSIRSAASRASLGRRAAGVAKVGAQIVVLWVILTLSNAMVAHLGLRIPGNIIGLGVLFVLLSTGLVKERWVSAGGTFLTRHL